MTKHTKGKWKINQYNEAVYTDLNDHILFERPHGGEGKNNFEANAKLISAAPEMLSALKEAQEIIQRATGTNSFAIEQALKKAEGEK